MARIDGALNEARPAPPPLAVGKDLRGDHPAFPLRPQAREGLLGALTGGHTKYVDATGIEPLREQTAKALSRYGIQADPHHQLIITAGEQEARFLAFQALRSAGLRLIVPSIVHPGAPKAATLSGLPHTRVPLDVSSGAPDLASVQEALAGADKAALYLESPNRFTGKLIAPDAFGLLYDSVRRSGGIVIWDASSLPWLVDRGVYREFGETLASDDSTITIGTVWAGAGVEGWMIAYLALPASLREAAKRAKQAMVLCTSVPVQWATLSVLLDGTDEHDGQIESLNKVKEAALRAWPGEVLAGEAVCHLAAVWPGTAVPAGGVQGMPGSAFGIPHAMRFTVTPGGEVVSALQLSGDAQQTAGRGSP